MEPIFREGDRVYTFELGWITIKSFEKVFNGTNYYKAEGVSGLVSEKYLSFTEFTFQNFNQERPIDWNDYIGQFGFFKDEDCDEGVLGELTHYSGSSNEYPFLKRGGDVYRYFTPLPQGLQETINKLKINK
jgi:hypothetical protein